jgi:peptidoglycan/LPS O-acetylase OafA/YrhL
MVAVSDDCIDKRSDTEIAYRADIDGLRAIAILAVLGYHALPGIFPGGFVGVDVFFVVSGYLISGIVLRALRRGSFSFAGFYARRIRRIFPALALVLAATCLAGWYLLLPDEFARLGKEVAAGAGFVANISFWKERGYFDVASRLKPLLHLWSLGVEEQFYLIWPFMLLIATRRKLNPLMMCIAVLLGSFVLNVMTVHRHEAAAFYLITARFWELALGGAYACYESMRSERAAVTTPPPVGRVESGGARTQHRPGADLMACAGMVLIIGSIAGLDSRLVYPGWWALGPTLGSIALIASGPHAWVNRCMLSLRPMVFVGLISYPLYLWHWPLLSFYAILAPERTTTTVTLLIVAGAGVLAWLTYEYLEVPIRGASHAMRASLIRPAASLFASVAVIGTVGFLAYRGAVLPRSANHGLEQIMAATNSVAYPGPRLQNIGRGDLPLRRQGSNPRIVLFIGDSFIEQYYPRIDWLLQAHPASAETVVFASSGGCPPIPKVTESHHSGCGELLARAERYAKDPHVDSIVIGADWGAYFLATDPRYSYRFDDGAATPLRFGAGSADRAFTELQSMIARFRNEGKRVWLILQNPDDAAMNPRHLIESRWGSDGFRIRKSLIPAATLMRPVRPIGARLREIAAATGAAVIDPVDFLCDAYCPATTADGLPLYRDDGHLNPAFVRTRVRYLDSIIVPDLPVGPAQAPDSHTAPDERHGAQKI